MPDAGRDGTGYSFYKKALSLAAKFIDMKDSVRVADLNKFEQYGKDANSIGLKLLNPYIKNLEPVRLKDIIKEIAA